MLILAAVWNGIYLRNIGKKDVLQGKETTILALFCSR